MSTLFMLNPEYAEEFFERCLHAEAITEEERVQILCAMVEEGKATMVSAPQLSAEEVKEALKDNFNVMDVTKSKKAKPEEENNG